MTKEPHECDNCGKYVEKAIKIMIRQSNANNIVIGFGDALKFGRDNYYCYDCYNGIKIEDELLGTGDVEDKTIQLTVPFDPNFRKILEFLTLTIVFLGIIFTFLVIVFNIVEILPF